MTGEWKNPSAEEVVKQVQEYMGAIKDGAEIGAPLCYSESAFKHLLGLGYFPGIKLTPKYQAEEVNARLAPKWPRIIRDIRLGISFDKHCERVTNTGEGPGGLMGLLKYTAETTGLDIGTLTQPIPEYVAGAFSASAAVRRAK